MKAIYLFIFLVGSCANTPSGNPITDTTYKHIIITDTTRKHLTIADTSYKHISIYDTTHKRIIVTDTTYNHVRITDTTHKDSVVWNIVLKDTSLIIPLYIDKRLAPYLNDSLKIRFKITYSR